MEGSKKETQVCQVCEKSFYKYMCPRCHMPYCGVACYKHHSQSCVTQFETRQAKEMLQGAHAGEESRREMLKIIRKFSSQDDTTLPCSEAQQEQLPAPLTAPTTSFSVGPNPVQFENRSSSTNNAFFLKEKNSNSHDQTSIVETEEEVEILTNMLQREHFDFSNLSARQQKLFQQALPTLQGEIQPWRPWWLRKVFGEEDQLPPAVLSPLPPLKELTTAPPSPLLPCHLVDILLSYVSSCRLFNGLFEPLDEWVDLVLEQSAVLRENQPASMSQVLQTHMAQCLKPPLSLDRIHSAHLLHDLDLLLAHKPYSLAALSEIHTKFTEALNIASFPAHNKKKGSEDIPVTHVDQTPHSSSQKSASNARKTLRMAQRKLFFFIVWLNAQPLNPKDDRFQFYPQFANAKNNL